MSGFGNFLYVRTLGEPGMFMNGRKLETAFPSPEAREIFLSLLSPLDECTGWERLENVIRGNPSVTRRKALVRKGVKEIKKMFLRTAGINPLREYPHGVGLDFRTVRVDVHDFRELSFKGLKLFAEGDHAAAGPCLRRALALYAGPFLPGDSGRIIDAAREDTTFGGYRLMKIFTKLAFKCLILAALSFMVFGCGGGGGGGGSSTPTTSVSGSVFAGPAAGTAVTVKTAAGAVVAGPVSTASDGSYTILIPTSALSGDLVFEATGGSFPDEATGTSGVAFGTLSARIDAGTLTGGANVTIDPAGTIIRKLIAGGMTRAAAEAAFATAFGYTPDVSVRPAFANVSSASSGTQRLCGLRAAAFSQLVMDLGLAPDKQFELLQALADDLSDGILDGKSNTNN